MRATCRSKRGSFPPSIAYTAIVMPGARSTRRTGSGPSGTMAALGTKAANFDGAQSPDTGSMTKQRTLRRPQAAAAAGSVIWAFHCSTAAR
jgi:hypothetical protein